MLWISAAPVTVVTNQMNVLAYFIIVTFAEENSLHCERDG
jgi:hypothetical protein